MKKVFVVGGCNSTTMMFIEAGWANVSDPVVADFLCFTGGADVSPELYGETNEGLSFTSPKRDEAELALFKAYPELPKIGICRGGQFLNVMSGGKMIQDLPKQHSGYRNIRIAGNKTVTLHEDHHQGMLLAPGSQIIGVDQDDGNIEILYYPHTKSLCFQAHPEWGHDPTREYFFQLIKEYFA